MEGADRRPVEAGRHTTAAIHHGGPVLAEARTGVHDHRAAIGQYHAHHVATIAAHAAGALAAVAVVVVGGGRAAADEGPAAMP